MARNLIPSDADASGDQATAIRAIASATATGCSCCSSSSGGSHGWRFDYRFHGKRKLLSLGTYPETSLALGPQEGRRGASTARRRDRPEPQAQGGEGRLRGTVEAEEARGARACRRRTRSKRWRASGSRSSTSGWAPEYAEKIIARLESDVFPWIGRAPVAAITPPQLLEVLRRIESRGVVETAHRALENCSQVFRYGIAIGLTTDEPGADLKDRARATAAEALRRRSPTRSGSRSCCAPATAMPRRTWCAPR